VVQPHKCILSQAFASGAATQYTCQNTWHKPRNNRKNYLERHAALWAASCSRTPTTCSNSVVQAGRHKRSPRRDSPWVRVLEALRGTIDAVTQGEIPARSTSHASTLQQRHSARVPSQPAQLCPPPAVRYLAAQNYFHLFSRSHHSLQLCAPSRPCPVLPDLLPVAHSRGPDYSSARPAGARLFPTRLDGT
jgi:hypothetical protein